jgi:hypothetical protein
VFKALLIKISRQLSKDNIPYMVIGGQAVLYYGEPRLTEDIDITLGIGIEEYKKIERLTDTLSMDILVENPKDFIKKTMVLPVMDKKTGIRVDFIFSFSVYEREAIKRAVGVKFNNHTVKFGSVEDIIIHKIISGRPRDIEDVENIMIKNPIYNGEYIKKWLQEFDKSPSEHLFQKFKEIEEKLKERE